jgi:hypothetical protein
MSVTFQKEYKLESITNKRDASNKVGARKR